MNSKQKKQILEQFTKIDCRIKELEDELQIEKSKKIINLIDEEKKELLKMQSLVRLAISKLPNTTEQRIIYLKYIKTLPLWKIANELGYSPDYIKHLHLIALQHLELTVSPLFCAEKIIIWGPRGANFSPSANL